MRSCDWGSDVLSMSFSAWLSWQRRAFASITNCSVQKYETSSTTNADAVHCDKLEGGCHTNTMLSVEYSRKGGVGSEGARGLVTVARCAVSRSLRRWLVPMINVRGWRSVVEAGRRWTLDGRGTRTSCEKYICSPGNAGGGRAKGAIPPSGRQLPVRKVPG